MRNSVILLIVFTLINCGVGTSSTTEPEKKESEMIFGKGEKENYVIFSPMDGVLMQNGKPMAHTKIIRRLRWNGNDEDGLVEEFTTDEAGRFSLPIHEEQLSLGVLNQFVGKADLEFETVDGRDYLWTSSKFSPEIYSETDGEVHDLTCDIESDEIAVPMGPTSILTKCRWKNMPQ